MLLNRHSESNGPACLCEDHETEGSFRSLVEYYHEVLKLDQKNFLEGKAKPSVNSSSRLQMAAAAHNRGAEMAGIGRGWFMGLTPFDGKRYKFNPYEKPASMHYLRKAGILLTAGVPRVRRAGL
jgi:hypothetical protein